MGGMEGKGRGEAEPLEAALAALGAEDLRRLIRRFLVFVGKPLGEQLGDLVLECAARKGAGWRRGGPSREEVEEVLAFAEEAWEEGWAEEGFLQVLLGDLRGAAAMLEAACLEVESDPGKGALWVEGIRREYKRYPAFQEELSQILGRGPEGAS